VLLTCHSESFASIARWWEGPLEVPDDGGEPPSGTAADGRARGDRTPAIESAERTRERAAAQDLRSSPHIRHLRALRAPCRVGCTNSVAPSEGRDLLRDRVYAPHGVTALRWPGETARLEAHRVGWLAVRMCLPHVPHRELARRQAQQRRASGRPGRRCHLENRHRRLATRGRLLAVAAGNHPAHF
jgi:hypothetical protein